jgi:hypothetical protein
MWFEEQLLTDNKADENHSRIVSFHNCMLRIPGSLNSKCIQLNDRCEIMGDIPPEAEVRIIQHWDGNRPSIKPLLSVISGCKPQQLGISKGGGKNRTQNIVAE